MFQSDRLKFHSLFIKRIEYSGGNFYFIQINNNYNHIGNSNPV